jgi:hypothetical protein
MAKVTFGYTKRACFKRIVTRRNLVFSQQFSVQQSKNGEGGACVGEAYGFSAVTEAGPHFTYCFSRIYCRKKIQSDIEV